MAKRRRGGRRRGNAQTLRIYWTHGTGGRRKVVWGTPGDFNRCVRHVGKYLRNPKGYCNLRHKAATGIWPAQHAKALRGGRKR